MKKLFQLILIIIPFFIISCSTLQQVQNMIVSTNNYFRVESFPTQDESTLVGAFSDSQIEYTFDYPIHEVWKSALRTAKTIEGLTQSKAVGLTLPSLRPIVIVDEEKYIIQNGKVEDAGDIGHINYVGYGSDRKGWADEIIIQLTKISEKQTKILVQRNLYKGEPVVIDKYGTSFKDKLVKRTSNGNYERWVITQIDDDLQGKLKRTTIAVKKLKTISKPALSFSYTPLAQSALRKINLSKINSSLIIRGFKYIDKSQLPQIFSNLGVESSNNINYVFSEMRNSFNKNIDDVLISKGINISKSFENIESMNYPDRDASILVLDENIKLNITESYNPNQKPKTEFKSSAVQDTMMPTILNGKIKISLNIELVLYEPFSREKMWSKIVNLEPQEADFSLSFALNQDEYYGGEMKSENVIYGEDYRAEKIAQYFANEYKQLFDRINDEIKTDDIIISIEAAKKLREKRKY